MKPVSTLTRRFAGTRMIAAWSVAACLAAAGFVLVCSTPSNRVPRERPELAVRVSPLSLSGNSRLEVDLPADRLRTALARLAQHDFLRWGQLTHGLRLWGPEASGPGKWTGKRMLDVVCSAEESEKAFGFAPHLLNRNGLQFRHRKIEELVYGEKHLDETLSTLGEIGIHSDRQIRVWDQTTTVSETVRAAAANFTQDQLLDFTPVAFALYLPPQRTWTNKFGETFSFDDVCQRLCDQPLGEGGCIGTHAIYSLAMVLAADKQYEILSDVSRRKVRSKLLQAINALRKTQRDDGSWDAQWFDPAKAAPPKDFASTVTATGHSLEWLAVAPQEIIDDPKMISRACEAALTLLLTAPPESLRDEHNYYTHAAAALKMWSPQAWIAAKIGR